MSKLLGTEPAQLIVDPITEAARLLNHEEKLKNEKIRIDKQHDQNIKAWIKDKTRVNRFKNLDYKLTNDSNICIEVCTSYIKDTAKERLIYDSFFNLSLNEEYSLRLFPFVKDLSTGDIYTISDAFTISRPNPGYADWVNIASEKPSYKDEVPAPPKMVFLIDNEWDRNRFFLDKIKQIESPADYYTFIVPKAVLQMKYKFTDKKEYFTQNQNIDTTSDKQVEYAITTD